MTQISLLRSRFSIPIEASEIRILECNLVSLVLVLASRRSTYNALFSVSENCRYVGISNPDPVLYDKITLKI